MSEKFYQKSISERHDTLAQQANLSSHELEAYMPAGG